MNLPSGSALIGRLLQFGRALRRLGLDVHTAHNAVWQRGMGSSIRCGVQALRHASLEDAVLFVVCDQLRVTTAHLNRMISAFREGAEAEENGGCVVVHRKAVFGAGDLAQESPDMDVSLPPPPLVEIVFEIRIPDGYPSHIFHDLLREDRSPEIGVDDDPRGVDEGSETEGGELSDMSLDMRSDVLDRNVARCPFEDLSPPLVDHGTDRGENIPSRIFLKPAAPEGALEHLVDRPRILPRRRQHGASVEPRELAPGLELRLRYRFYTQTAADFFKDTYSAAEISDPERHKTDDEKLSAFRTHTFGGQLSFALGLFALSYVRRARGKGRFLSLLGAAAATAGTR